MPRGSARPGCAPVSASGPRPAVSHGCLLFPGPRGLCERGRGALAVRLRLWAWRRKTAEGKGRSHQSRQGRCDHQDLSLSTLNLTTWLTCCLWSLSGSSTAKVSFPPFPMLRLAAGSPTSSPRGGRREPLPQGEVGRRPEAQGSGAGGVSCLHWLSHPIACLHHNGLISRTA